MSVLISERDLPQALTVEQSVDAAYPTELADIASALGRGLPVLIECEKDLAPFVFVNLRNRLKAAGWKCQYLDGRPPRDAVPAAAPAAVADAASVGTGRGSPTGLTMRSIVPHSDAGSVGHGVLETTLRQLRETVRGATERRVLVLPHLDLLTSAPGGLSAEAREVIALVYENPEHVWLGFKDPSLSLPKVIESLFPRRQALLGVPRPRLRHLVTQREARKFGREFNPWALYKYVSGVNAARLRKLLSTLDGEDFPADPKRAYAQVRQATLHGFLEIPDVDLDKSLGGYARVKQRLRTEILDVLATRDALTDEAEISRREALLPRGLIFWGPPGTGKTLFAKAMATALGAAITIVSGPELKSRWVGQSEENLRQIFHRARQSAPSLIVFDELDSFAAARGSYGGSGVEHSMVNQLLTEMDGFHREELVFVVGTTNFVESLDPALLRPGRFEFHLHIPYPDFDDRLEILKIYDRTMGLSLTDEAFAFAARRTGGRVEGAAVGTRFSGDHLHALCRSIARARLRGAATGATTPDDIERALDEATDRPQLDAIARHVLAVREAGRAVCALACEHATPIERIALRGGASDEASVEATVRSAGATRGRLLDDLCALFGGYEAQQHLLGDVSWAADELRRASAIARTLVVEFGLIPDDGGPLPFLDTIERHAGAVAESTRAESDRRIGALLRAAQERAAALVVRHRGLVESLAERLMHRNEVDDETLASARTHLRTG